jgi:pimeloyl-ACP methyl ester carboxylesterase
MRAPVVAALLLGLPAGLRGHDRAPANSWTDPSPHTSHLVTANGVKLHYLDWGGRGEVVLLLGELGCTAHVFDNLAPRLTASFHVLALTRRGFGGSAKPDTGYDTETLVADLDGFLDALKIGRVTLIGHGFAGDELTAFAARHPDRVRRLVYLDAAYDHSTAPAGPGISMKDVMDVTRATGSLEALRAFCRGHLGGLPWCEALEAELREHVKVRPNGSVEIRDLARSLKAYRALLKAHGRFKPDYAGLTTPALCFYALGGSQAGAAAPRKQQQRAEKQRQWQREQIDLMRGGGPRVRVVEMAGTPHFCFLRDQDAATVVKEIGSFLAPPGK